MQVDGCWRVRPDIEGLISIVPRPTIDTVAAEEWDEKIIARSSEQDIGEARSLNTVVAAKSVDDVHTVEGFAVDDDPIDQRATRIKEDQFVGITGHLTARTGDIVKLRDSDNSRLELGLCEGFGSEIEEFDTCNDLDTFVETMPTDGRVREDQLAGFVVAGEFIFDQLTSKDQAVDAVAADDGVFPGAGRDNVISVVRQDAVVSARRLENLVGSRPVHGLSFGRADPDCRTVDERKRRQLNRFKADLENIECLERQVGELRNIEEIGVDLIEQSLELISNLDKPVEEIDIGEQRLKGRGQLVEEFVDTKLILEVVDGGTDNRIKDRAHGIEQRFDRTQGRFNDIEDVLEAVEQTVELEEVTEDLVQGREIHDVEHVEKCQEVGLGGIISVSGVLGRSEGHVDGCHKVIGIVEQVLK